MIRRWIVVAALTLPVAALEGQIMRVPRTTQQPGLWVSFGPAYILDQGLVRDGSTGSTWDFASAVQYRGALEVAVGRDASVGATAIYSRPSLLYTAAGTSCSLGCDAHATIRSLLASFHAGGGIGFRPAFDLMAGLTQFADFRDDRSGASLAPENGDVDFTMGFGQGFGYGLNDHAQIEFTWDYDITIHQHQGLRGNESARMNQLGLRLGVRYGF